VINLLTMGDSNAPDPPTARRAKRKLNDTDAPTAPGATPPALRTTQTHGPQSPKKPDPSNKFGINPEQDDTENERDESETDNSQQTQDTPMRWGDDAQNHTDWPQGPRNREMAQKTQRLQVLLEEIGSILTGELDYQTLLGNLDEKTHEILAELTRNSMVTFQGYQPSEYEDAHSFLNTGTPTQARSSAIEDAIDRLTRINEKLHIKIEKLEAKLEENANATTQHQRSPATNNPGPAPAATQAKYSAALKSTNQTAAARQVQRNTRTFDTTPNPAQAHQRYHPSRLVITADPPISFDSIKPGETVRDINTKLAQATPPAPENVRVQGIIPSSNSRTPIIIAAPSCTAQDLAEYEHIILKVLIPETNMLNHASAVADQRRYEICINGVPLRTFTGEFVTPGLITSALAVALRHKGELPQATTPKFLITPSAREQAKSATVLISFHDKETAERVLNSGGIFIDGYHCSVRKYVERERPPQCRNCHTTQHRTGSRSCQGQRCVSCGAADHPSLQHPTNTPPKCINCAGEHGARDRACPARQQTNTNRCRQAERAQQPLPRPTPGTNTSKDHANGNSRTEPPAICKTKYPIPDKIPNAQRSNTANAQSTK
jgi:hypothetical protein